MEYNEFKTLPPDAARHILTDAKDILRFMYAELDGSDDLSDTGLETLDTTAESLRSCVVILETLRTHGNAPV